MLFFAVVYLVEGFGQTGGLIAQPLNYYLKEVYGWTPVRVTASLTVLTLGSSSRYTGSFPISSRWSAIGARHISFPPTLSAPEPISGPCASPLRMG
jgi:hypothetical protein